MKKFAAFTLVLALAAGTANAQLTEGASVSYDFDTDQSGSFAIATSGPDTASNFSYDYATHTQIAPAIQVAIPSAPNTPGSTTLGLRLEVSNVDPTEFNSILAYPDVSTLDLSDGFILTFDFWNNHNGDAGGASGSTEFMFTGASSGNTIGDPTIAGAWGFGATGDGGAGQDYRYYQDGVRDTGPVSGLNVDSGVEPFLSLFPNDGSAAGIPPATTIFAGVAGKQWVTATVRVEAGVSRTLSLTSAASGTPVLVSTISAPTGPDTVPFAGIVDIFSGSTSNPAADNFLVIDNVTVTELLAPPPSAATEWNVYN